MAIPPWQSSFYSPLQATAAASGLRTISCCGRPSVKFLVSARKLPGWPMHCTWSSLAGDLVGSADYPRPLTKSSDQFDLVWPSIRIAECSQNHPRQPYRHCGFVT